ncbi:TonB-dependent receptor [Capnocytophaga sp. H2931]|uniref:TonB-dependent receptor n=1 Tax=Capnocytophaga sp. H2931 TaxID=1945657 RepID=UPI000BB1ADAF|nr:TonB-dependent receptor [Capnocytophaga sp. H2931]ATA75027.1 TonB-dependent receptor [Capnocytophaga sp. H2931]
MKKLFFMGAMSLITSAYAQTIESEKDSINQDVIQLDEVLVSAVRADRKTPIAFSSINKKELAKRNLGQDIPILLNFMPSVVTTSDAGNGVGYTGIRVRGSDATRVNVTINGIPYNDSESHGTFWVNMPDFASSVENIQLQRGVGTSTNGSGAFGASLNMLTDASSYESNALLSTSYGSYNTQKHTAKFSTGLMNNTFELSGRLSKLYSDGYIDRASSKLNSYFLQGAFVDKGTLIKGLVFGGNEKTYQAWNGVDEEEMKKYGRRYNPSGKHKDNNGNTVFYDNETDNYKQDHAQLHWNQRWSNMWNTNFALHYTKGFGYYENYKKDQKLSKHGIKPIESGGVTSSKSDLIRRKYLDNDFYGAVFSLNYKNKNLDFTFGSSANRYVGDHFGEILWVRKPAKYNFKQEYYRDDAIKTEANNFLKATYSIGKWIFFGDLQLRNVNYKANSEDTGLVNDSFDFFNPKAGVTYSLNTQNQLYISYAKAQREPNRDDYENGNPRPEKLNDFEGGWRFKSENIALNINGYYMQYQDQLVLTGALNDVGAPVRENSGKSYRLGVEIDAVVKLGKWQIQPSVTLSQNKNIDFYTNFDGKLVNLGNTNISYSPNIVAGNGLTFNPLEGLQLSLFSKYVGEQFMSNTDADKSKLNSYLINDLSINYQIPMKKWAKSVTFSLLVNNILNEEYISNGYYYTYDDDWTTVGVIKTIEGTGFYPQAERNFLAGVTVSF